MIDTDKYEGHTKGPWKWLKNSILLKGRAYATNKNAHFPSFIITGRHLDGGWPIDNEADAQLIANAPLLLEEVKRLREELDGREAYIKRLSEQLARMTKWSYKQVLHNDSAMMDFDDYVWGEKND